MDHVLFEFSHDVFVLQDYQSVHRPGNMLVLFH